VEIVDAIRVLVGLEPGQSVLDVDIVKAVHAAVFGRRIGPLEGCSRRVRHPTRRQPGHELALVNPNVIGDPFELDEHGRLDTVAAVHAEVGIGYEGFSDVLQPEMDYRAVNVDPAESQSEIEAAPTFTRL
jgi:hypothetical protein